MSVWTEEAVRQAIALASVNGMTDLESDLRRLAVAIDFEDLEIMRSVDAEELSDDIIHADTFQDLIGLLRRITTVLGVDHCTVHLVRESSLSDFRTRVVTTYPDEWTTRYVERRYSFIDPVSAACAADLKSFYWDALSTLNPAVNSFWRDAATFGIGSSGYSLPLRTEHGDIVAVSVSSIRDAFDFKDRFRRHHEDFLILGLALGDTFRRIASNDRPASFNPSDDEIMLLRSIARGEDETAMQAMDYLYGSYTTTVRSVCRQFQTKTAAQAAVLAGRLGLLDDTPLVSGDIMASAFQEEVLVFRHRRNDDEHGS